MRSSQFNNGLTGSILHAIQGSLMVFLTLGLLVFMAVSGIHQAHASLLNVDFGQDGGPSRKVGVAAVGQSVNDFWNFYSRDGAEGWQTYGVLPNLKLADGTQTMAGLTVANAPGSWGTSSVDPMYAGYVYPLSGGYVTITVTNMDAGKYQLYVYAHDGNYQLAVGATSYGVKTCRDNAFGGVPVWQEGRQYVRFDEVRVAAGQVLTLTVQPGLDGYAIISGLQLVCVAEPPPGQFLANVDFGAGAGPSAKAGPAAIGQATNDFWNFYTRDDGAGGWRTFGVLSNLKLANGVTTGVGMMVANAPGAWGTTSADQMYVDYIYPFNGDVTLTVTNLPVGEYDLYLYGPDSKYVVQVGGVSYGLRSNVDSAATGTPVWQEGVQYARYGNVLVSNSTQAVVITVQPGIYGYATISGLQIRAGSTQPPAITSQPASQSVYVGENVIFTVAATGTAPLSYQWRLNGTNIPGAIENSYAVGNVQSAQAGNYSATVSNSARVAISSNAALVVVQHATNNLLNIDFGQDAGPSGKFGAAAVGQATNDFWNYYSRDGAGGWQTYGVLPNLKLADGATTLAGLTVANAPGSWGTSSTDPMYAGYVYPFSGVATITLTNLSVGQYELYVYAYDGNYRLTVGATDYGSKTSRDNAVGGVPIWQEGRQYVRFNGVNIAAGQALTLTVQPGLDGYAIVSGMQLVYVAPPPPSHFLVNVDFGAGAGPSAKVGPAAMGQSPNDVWNFYTRDDGVGGWRTFGALSNLTLANGTTTGVGMTVANAPGAWGTTSIDRMYVDYIYPFSGDATLTVTNLPVGEYDLYLYGPDSKYVVQAGGKSYGMQTNMDSAATGSPVWQEGVQYARYGSVVVGNSTQAVVITVQPGIYGYATISGLQIAQTAPAEGTNHCGRLSLHCNAGNWMRLHFAGTPSHRYRVQASTNLIHWVDLGCVISDNGGNCEFEDSNSNKFPQRYYRIVLP